MHDKAGSASGAANDHPVPMRQAVLAAAIAAAGLAALVAASLLLTGCFESYGDRADSRLRLG